MRNLSIAFCLACLFLSTSCRQTAKQPHEDPRPMLVRGKLVDSDSGARISGAIAVLLGSHSVALGAANWFEVAKTTSDSDGVFQFDETPEVRDLPLVTVEIRSPDHATMLYKPVSVSPIYRYPRSGKPTDLGRIELFRTVNIRGFVLGRDGSPIRDAALTWSLRSDFPIPPYWTCPLQPPRSDRDGRFDIAVPNTIGALQCSASGYVAVAHTVGPTWFDEEQRLILEPAQALRGQVVDTYGKPVAGARVRIHAARVDGELPPDEFVATTNPDGHVAFDGLPILDNGAATVHSPNHVTRSLEFDCVDSGFQLVVERGRRVRFTLDLPDASPLPNIVMLSSPELEDDVVQRRGDHYLTPVLPTAAGSGVLIVPGFAPCGIQWPAGEGDHDAGLISLELGRSIWIQATHADGAPLANANVMFRPEISFAVWGLSVSLSGLHYLGLTNEQGLCKLAGIVKTEGRLILVPPEAASRELELYSGDPEQVIDMVLPAPASLALSFTDTRTPGRTDVANWRLVSSELFSPECTPALTGAFIGWQLYGSLAPREACELEKLSPDVELELEVTVGTAQATVSVEPLEPREHRELEVDFASLAWSGSEQDFTTRESVARSFGQVLTPGSDQILLSVQVIDASGTPQPNATVTAWEISPDPDDHELGDFLEYPSSEATNQNGIATLSGLPYEELALSVAGKTGVAVMRFRPRSVEEQVTIVLEPGVPYTTRVINQTPSNPNAPAEAEVTLQGVNGRWLYFKQEAATKFDGSVTLFAPPGPVTLEVDPEDDRDSLSFEAESASDLPTRIPFPLTGWNLHLASPEPLRARTVTIEVEGPDKWEHHWRGHYTTLPTQPIWVPLPTGQEYSINVRSSGHAPVTDHLAQIDDQGTVVSIQLESLAEPVFLHVRTVQDDGSPLPWIVLQAGTARTDFGSFYNLSALDWWSFSDGDGYAVLPIHPGFEHRILAEANGFGALDHSLTTQEIESHQSREHPLLLRFNPEGSILVRIVTPDGRPVRRDVHLRHTLLNGSEHDSAVATFDEDVSGYRFTGLAPKEYTIRVTEDWSETVVAEKTVTIASGASIETTVEVPDSDSD